jgi:hypothetical protein
MHRLAPLLLLFLLGALALITGCEQQLFSKDEPRSQYDRFDAVRDRRQPPEVEDEFGNKHPNLRGRLLTSE